MKDSSTGVVAVTTSSQFGSGGMRAAGAPNRAGRPLDSGVDAGSVVTSMFGERPTLLKQSMKASPTDVPMPLPAVPKTVVESKPRVREATTDATPAKPLEPFKMDAKEAAEVSATISSVAEATEKLAAASLSNPTTDAGAALDVAQDVVGKLTAEEVKKATAPVTTEAPVAAEEVPVVVAPAAPKEAVTQEALAGEEDVDFDELYKLLGAKGDSKNPLPVSMPTESLGNDVLVAFKKHAIHEGGSDVTISAIAVLPDGSVTISTSTSLAVSGKDLFNQETFMQRMIKSTASGAKGQQPTSTQVAGARKNANMMVDALHKVNERTEQLVSKLTPKTGNTLSIVTTLGADSTCAKFVAKQVKNAAEAAPEAGRVSPYFGEAHNESAVVASTPAGNTFDYLKERPFFVA